MIIALAGAAALLQGTVALHLGARNGSDALSGGGGAARNASTPSGRGVCMEGASPDEFPTTASAEATAGFVRHPSGLTFRTYILDKRLHQAERLKRGVWEASEQTFIVNAFKSDPNCTRPVFIDGGAAFGFYSLLAAFHSPCREVQAFNPHPLFAECMKQNIDDNVRSGVLRAPKICINQLALAGREGMAKIDFGYAAKVGANVTNMSFVPVPVRMTSLDAWAEQHLPGDKQILLVKLDIEGKEVEALGGATKLLQGCRVKFWAIGIHYPETRSLRSVVATLTKNGYRIISSSTNARGQPNGEVLAQC